MGRGHGSALLHAARAQSPDQRGRVLPDGKTLASCDHAGNIHLWEAGSLPASASLTSHQVLIGPSSSRDGSCARRPGGRTCPAPDPSVREGGHVLFATSRQQPVGICPGELDEAEDGRSRDGTAVFIIEPGSNGIPRDSATIGPPCSPKSSSRISRILQARSFLTADQSAFGVKSSISKPNIQGVSGEPDRPRSLCGRGSIMPERSFPARG